MLKEYLEMLLEMAVGEEPGQESQTDDNNAETNTEETNADTSVEEGKETNEGTDDGTETNSESEVEVPTEIDIDGVKVPIDEIKQWKQGYMRQSDYTKKTQEISNFRKENAQAIEIYNFLKSNPELAKQLAEYDPSTKQTVEDITNPQISQLQTQLNAIQIDNDLNRIKSADKSVNEIELLDIANKYVVPINVAYDIWKGQNADKIVQNKLVEQSKNLTKEIKTNNSKVKTAMTSKTQTNLDYGLTEAEKSMATKLGMDYKEYAKWK